MLESLSITKGRTDPSITLGVLVAVESNALMTQRKLSSELGIALGLTNVYLRRCVRKGWVKISAVPMRRYAYYLTPQGFTEKARLTGEYLSANLELFRRTRRELTGLLTRARAQGVLKIVLIGAGDLAEVATLSALESDIAIFAVIDPAEEETRCAGFPVVKSLDALKDICPGPWGIGAVMITASRDPIGGLALAETTATALGLTAKNILVPRVLILSRPVELFAGAPRD